MARNVFLTYLPNKFAKNTTQSIIFTRSKNEINLRQTVSVSKTDTVYKRVYMKYLFTITLLGVFTMTFAQKYSNEFLNIGVGAAAQSATVEVEQMTSVLGVPVLTYDERLTTVSPIRFCRATM